MTTVPTFTFAGGVLSRALWGRYDLTKFQTGLKKAENCVLSVEGGVEKRFGTYYTGKRKSQDSADKAKLIPWRIADDDSYMLEFGSGYIRFIRFGGYVSIPNDHVADPDSIAVNVSGYMEVATPWTGSAVSELKYTFANDIMYIAHSSHPPQQLQRLGLYDWNLVEQDYDPHPDWVGAVTGTYTDDTTPDDNYIVEPVPTRYKVSATLSDGTETKPSPAEVVNADLGHRRTKVELDWPDFADAEQYTIYKGANGIFGFIGYTSVSNFTDRNYAPSYEVVPIGKPLSFDEENPSLMEFYKQRMAYAATFSKPQDIWFSRPYIFNSLTTSVPLQDDDAFNLPLVGRQRHTINHMVMLKKFLIFTDSAEWTLNTVNNEAISAASADPVIETYYGAHPWLRPLSIGNRIVFIQHKTGAVLDMGYEFTSDAFKADDLTRLTRDLFKNKQTVAWDYATHPQNILLCALSDGTLNVMTYVREHEIWGWTTWLLDGKVLDVACVTEIDHEGIYIQIERLIDGVPTYFIERVEMNFNNRIEDMIFSDCSLTYKDEYNVTLFWLSSTSIEFGFIGNPFIVNDLVRIEISEDEYYIGKIISKVGTTTTMEPSNQTISFPEHVDSEQTIYRMAKTFTGFNHLEGEAVSVLADGKVYKDITIAVGGFTLPKEFARVQVGLPYKARIETLDMDVDQVKGQYKEKTVHEVTLNLRQSRAVWIGAAGSDYPMQELKNRNSGQNMYDANEALEGPYDLLTHINWNKTTEIIIESSDPLPLNVLNIAPDIRYGS